MDECIHEFKETLCDIGHAIVIVWWVEPQDIAFPLALAVGCGVWVSGGFLVLHAVLVATFLQSSLIGPFCFVEFVDIAGQAGDSLSDGVGKVL